MADAPWIGVGVSGDWTEVDDALLDAKLDFEVDQKPMYIEDLGVLSRRQMVPGMLCNVNIDTNDILGTVTDRYGVIQNHDAFHLLDPFLDVGGRIMHAGQTAQGMMFMVCKMGMQCIIGENYEIYVCVMNSFNAKFPLAVIITPVRVVCQNMFRKLMKGGDSALSIKHGSLANHRIRDAKAASAMVLDYMQGFSNLLETQSGNTDVIPIEGFVEKLFPYVPEDKKLAIMSNERIDLQRAEFIDTYYRADDNVRHHGTGLGLINAYYDYLSHRLPTRGYSGDWQDRRLSGMMSGNDVDSKMIRMVI